MSRSANPTAGSSAREPTATSPVSPFAEACPTANLLSGTVAERPNASALKAEGAKVPGGSNPSRSAHGVCGCNRVVLRSPLTWVSCTEWYRCENADVNIAESRSAATLDRLASGGVSTLIAWKADRLSWSTIDLLGLAERADREGWRLVVLDVQLDTASPTGRLVLTMTAGVAEFERRRIRERTRDASPSAKAQGVHLGRPAACRIRSGGRVDGRVSCDPRPLTPLSTWA